MENRRRMGQNDPGDAQRWASNNDRALLMCYPWMYHSSWSATLHLPGSQDRETCLVATLPMGATIHVSVRTFDGSSDSQDSQDSQERNPKAASKPPPADRWTAQDVPIIQKEQHQDARSLRRSLRDQLAAQAKQSGLFSMKKPWTEAKEATSSPRSPGASTGFHLRLPSFSASRAVPFFFTPLGSPLTTQSGGQQKGFFDSVALKKGSSTGMSPLTLYEALQSTPILLPPTPAEDTFRVRILGGKPESNEDFVKRLPDHLPDSPLCPRHPRHKSGGRGRCPVHGRNRTSEDSLTEEEEPVVRHKKDLKFFL